MSTDSTTALSVVQKRLPSQLLVTFQDGGQQTLYISLLAQYINEFLQEGSTLLQAQLVERLAFYFTKMRAFENTYAVPDGNYKFWTWEYNRASETLRGLIAKNLPEVQARNLAKKTLSIVNEKVKDLDLRADIIKEIVGELGISETEEQVKRIT